MNSRRDFLKTSGALVLGGLLPSQLLLANSLQKRKNIGLQLYSLRKDMAEDPQMMIRLVASIGYKTVETANYRDGLVYGMEPKFFRNYLNDLGLKMRSAHIGGPPFNPKQKDADLDWWKKAADDHKAMGAKYIIKPSMPIPKTISDLAGWCEYYNQVGEITKKSGLLFGFHNHAREFDAIEDQIMLDYMIENTDPKLVCFELDVYWAQKGGQDPAEYIKRYAGRFPLLHIKDEAEIGASGEMEFKEIFEAAYSQGMKDFFVEVEKYNYEPIESVKQSFDFLNTATFVK